MASDDRDAAARVRAFYADYHARMGNTLGWPAVGDARATYAAACFEPSIRWREVASVLDVGSGEGHLLSALRRRGFRGAYVGVELLEGPHRAAVRRYGADRDATFVHGDIATVDLGPAGFDWVFSLGSLAVRQPDQAAHDRRAVQRLVSIARVGVALYINDAGRVPPPQLDDLPELAAHDPGAVCALLIEAGCPPRNLRWYADDHSIMIHALRLR